MILCLARLLLLCRLAEPARGLASNRRRAMKMSGGGVLTVETAPIEGMRPGTSGLRKRTSVWQKTPNYLENFAQSLVEAWQEQGLPKEAVLVLGGDGRFFNLEALAIVSRILAANGVGRVLIPQHGVLSTPAASALVRARQADGAILLTASHNPGGPDGDFGIKFNTGPDGAPAREGLTEAVWERSKTVTQFLTVDAPFPELDECGEQALGDAVVEVVDADAVYLAQLKECFDFAKLKAFVASERPPKLLFDAMHGAAGPAARKVLVDELGVPESSLMRCNPLTDFGGGHPDPNLKWAETLVAKVGLLPDGSASPAATDVDLGGAFDGDGDRNMIVGAKFFVTPSDSLAILAARGADCIPWFAGGIAAVARSMPTSRALDRVAAAKKMTFFETPTGWKYFGNLMEKHQPFLCGEESFGTGADHVREKDGLWAALAWLSVLEHANAESDAWVSIADVAKTHWREFGRDFYCRMDFEECGSAEAEAMVDHLRTLVGKEIDFAPSLTAALDDLGGLQGVSEFEYVDSVDGSTATQQGIVLAIGESRAVFRLSGTGSAGATIRLYLETYVGTPTDSDLDDVAARRLKPLADAVLELSRLEEFTGRAEPDVVT